MTTMKKLISQFARGRNRFRKETDREYANIKIATIGLLISMHEVCSPKNKIKDVGWFLRPF
jgi:predicted RNA-binding protein associated with RNAse of E/G family